MRYTLSQHRTPLAVRITCSAVCRTCRILRDEGCYPRYQKSECFWHANFRTMYWGRVAVNFSWIWQVHKFCLPNHICKQYLCWATAWSFLHFLRSNVLLPFTPSLACDVHAHFAVRRSLQMQPVDWSIIGEHWLGIHLTGAMPKHMPALVLSVTLGMSKRCTPQLQTPVQKYTYAVKFVTGLSREAAILLRCDQREFMEKRALWAVLKWPFQT